MELEALQESLQEIKATGATLVAVSPMREPYLRQMAEKNHLEFDLLRDEGNVVSAKFGLVFRLPDDLIELYKTFGADLVRFNGDVYLGTLGSPKIQDDRSRIPPTLECRFWGASELTIRELIGSDNTGALSLPIL
jgi:hypothetical protein